MKEEEEEEEAFIIQRDAAQVPHLGAGTNFQRRCRFVRRSQQQLQHSRVTTYSSQKRRCCDHTHTLALPPDGDGDPGGGGGPRPRWTIRLLEGRRAAVPPSQQSRGSGGFLCRAPPGGSEHAASEVQVRPPAHGSQPPPARGQIRKGSRCPRASRVAAESKLSCFCFACAPWFLIS